MSTWLAFDAGSPVTSAAVARDGIRLAESSGEGRSGPSLLHHIDASLRGAAIAMADLDGIVVLCGPGSFTGIRVALATALGLRATFAMPVLGMSTLAALALQTDSAAGSPIVALVDALRDEWFVQEFRHTGQGLVALGSPGRDTAASLCAPPGARLAAHEAQPIPAHLAGVALHRAAALSAKVAIAASADRLGDLLSAALDPLYLRAFTPRTRQS